MLNRLRTYLSRMFIPDLYTPEGFRLTKRQYAGPQDTINLPPGPEKNNYRLQSFLESAQED
jgi:hypothetical protein